MEERSEAEKLQSFVKVQLTTPQNFKRIKDLLARIGINPHGTKKIFQTCHILKRGDECFICHFKELFWLDGRENGMSDIDYERRNRIVSILIERELIHPPSKESAFLSFSEAASKSVRVAPYSDLHNWELFPKYRFKKPKTS